MSTLLHVSAHSLPLFLVSQGPDETALTDWPCFLPGPSLPTHCTFVSDPATTTSEEHNVSVAYC